MPYRGRRPYTGNSRSPSGSGSGNVFLRALFFPAVFLYLELVLHISMGQKLSYLPVWLLFGSAGGLVCCALTLPFKRRVNSVLMKVITLLAGLVVSVELIAKKILQTFYPLSAVKMAAGNRLTDYSDVIVSTTVKNIPLILLVFLPAVLLFLVGSRAVGFQRYDIRMAGLVLAAAALFHLLGLGVVHLPWAGDLTPKQLYSMDTNIDDQVEQLGMLTMLRLDVKHIFFPVKNDLDADFSGLEGLGGEAGASGSASPAASEPEGPQEPAYDTSPNVMDVDLAAVAENSENDDVAWLANYFNSVTPTRKNRYTGMFKGYNVIQLVLEGFSGYVIDPELTPTLYKLTHEGFVFNNYYTALHFTSTSNGECQTLLGMYPKNGYPATMTRTGELGTNCYFSLAQQLGREGYLCQAYHANYEMYGRYVSHTNLGYDYRQYENGFDNLEMSEGGKLLWPQRDSYAVEASVDNYINSEQPFHVYYLTISGHMPYSDNRVVAPYRETVRALTQYSETTQNYIATAMEADKALKTLLDKLERAGKLDRTLIVATGDHIPYFDVETLEELTGREFGSSDDLQNIKESAIDFDVYKSSLILWSASMEEPVEVDKVCCQVDILPTVSNLLGLEYDSRMLDGSDILSDSEGLVVFSSRCWKSDRGFYNRFTQTFTPAPGVIMTQDEQENYVSAMKTLVSCKLESTPVAVEYDFFDTLFGGKQRFYAGKPVD